jgi:hypothetical protein
MIVGCGWREQNKHLRDCFAHETKASAGIGGVAGALSLFRPSSYLHSKKFPRFVWDKIVPICHRVLFFLK